MFRVEITGIDKDEIKKVGDKFLNAVKPLITTEDTTKLIEYQDKLLIVLSAYIATAKVVNETRSAQSSVVTALEEKNFIKADNQLKPAIEKFNLLHQRITAHFGLGHNVVPPIPAGLKDRIPAETYKIVEEARNKVGRYKNSIDKEYKFAESENLKFVELYNKSLKQVQKNQEPKVSSASQLPSSSHGFKPEQEAARAQAKSVNAGKVAPAESKSAKSGN